MLELDHLAVAAEDLKDHRARPHSKKRLKRQTATRRDSTPISEHIICCLGLDDGLYLEVIAIDPEAPSPAYPRWFDLDRFSGTPRLTNWICRTKRFGRGIEKLSAGRVAGCAGAWGSALADGGARGWHITV